MFVERKIVIVWLWSKFYTSKGKLKPIGVHWPIRAIAERQRKRTTVYRRTIVGRPRGQTARELWNSDIRDRRQT